MAAQVGDVQLRWRSSSSSGGQRQPRCDWGRPAGIDAPRWKLIPQLTIEYLNIATFHQSGEKVLFTKPGRVLCTRICSFLTKWIYQRWRAVGVVVGGRGGRRKQKKNKKQVGDILRNFVCVDQWFCVPHNAGIFYKHREGRSLLRPHGLEESSSWSGSRHLELRVIFPDHPFDFRRLLLAHSGYTPVTVIKTRTVKTKTKTKTGKSKLSAKTV